MSPELIVLCLILAAVVYLVIRFHVSLSKLVPGKAGDFLDDFKMNGSNIDHAAIVQAAVGGAANVVAATHPPVFTAPSTVIPGTAQEVSPLIASMIGASQKTSDLLNSRIGQSSSEQPAELAKDGVIRYFHHTEVYAGRFTTEPLQGKTKLQLTYTSQESGKTAPSQAWAKVNGGPEQGPMQAGVAAEWDLGDSGTPEIEVRFDTNGRMIGQLVAG